MLVRADMLASDWEGQGGLNGFDLADYVTVASEVVLYCEGFAILKSFEDAFVIHILSSGGDVNLVTFLKEEINCGS